MADQPPSEGRTAPLMPATLARASTRPPAAATTACTPSSVAMSPATGTRSRSGNSAASCSSRSAAMSAATTRAPSRARRSAVARPMREPAAGAAQGAQRLVPGGRRQPGADPFGVAQTVQVLDQPQPGGLAHIGGVGAAEAVGAGDRPDQAAEARDQPLPGPLVALGGGADRPHGRLSAVQVGYPLALGRLRGR